MGKGRSSYAYGRSSSATNSCRGTAVIAPSTAASLMPRRRNCFSIISRRCAAYSFFSSMCDCRRMSFPCAGFQNLFHLSEGKVAFIFAIVEVWRQSHAAFATVVDHHVPDPYLTPNLVAHGAFHF